ncbi:hypothetical protein Tco_0517605 [Tanacetum coccineum]
MLPASGVEPACYTLSTSEDSALRPLVFCKVAVWEVKKILMCIMLRGRSEDNKVGSSSTRNISRNIVVGWDFVRGWAIYYRCGLFGIGIQVLLRLRVFEDWEGIELTELSTGSRFFLKNVGRFEIPSRMVDAREPTSLLNRGERSRALARE